MIFVETFFVCFVLLMISRENLASGTASGRKASIFRVLEGETFSLKNFFIIVY